MAKIPGFSIDIKFLFDVDGCSAKISLGDCDPDTVTDESVAITIESMKIELAEKFGVEIDKVIPITMEQFIEKFGDDEEEEG